MENKYGGNLETDKAKSMARIVLTKEPKVQSTAVREMKEIIEEDEKDIEIDRGRN
jgi:hypothetical protein